MSERVIFYIDGYNLYFGLRSKFQGKYLWLNLHQLSLELLKKTQTLTEVKYFTTMVSSPSDKVLRQSTFIDALKTLPQCSIFLGHFQESPYTCKHCGHTHTVRQEKMTDVNIAVHLIMDSYQNCYDTAVIVSGDSDLVPPIQAVKQTFPNKKIVVAFPPNRVSKELIKVAHGYFHIGNDSLRKSKFTPQVISPSGVILQCPSSWK